tara:strand:+ start:1401 stop:2060 length:660 start_codon:yes stop_codon:yes gene_type:complete
MDLDLPQLDIVEDIEEIMDDKHLSVEEFEKDEAIELEKKQPFIKKPKKELSEKQKGHLDKIRGMALEKRQEKARAKKEAVDKVVLDIEETHKPKYYKPKPKKTPEEKELLKQEKIKYKKSTLKIIDEVEEPIIKTTPKDFVPDHKQLKKNEKEKELLNEQSNFNHFMGNMEQYLKLRDNFEKEKEKKKKPVVSPSPKPKEIPKPNILLPEQNIYSSFFG